MRWLLLCLMFFALVASGCASVGGPACERLRVGRAIVKTGKMPGTFNAKNKQLAMNAALVQAMSPLGLKVSFKLEARESETIREGRGGDESTFKSETTNVVKASFEQVEIRGMREDYCYEQGNVTARLIIPSAEWARLHRLARKQTVLVFRCTTAIPGACTSDNIADAKAAAREAGLRVSAVERTSDDLQTNHKTLVKLGLKHGGAWVLWVNLEGRDLGPVDGQYSLAVTDMQVNLLETSDRKVKASFSSGSETRPFKVLLPLKYTKPIQAARKSMHRALMGNDEAGVDGLQQLLQLWRDEGKLAPNN